VAVERCRRARQPQDCHHCRPDQPIDAARDGRLGLDTQGTALSPYLTASRTPIRQDIDTDSPQTRLNIPDMPMGGFVAGGAGAGPAAAAPVEEEEAAPAAAEKTLFNLKLEKFDAGAKPKVIKEIKAMLGLSLVDSKKFVESAPKLMKEGVPKEEAEKIVETLKALGATVVME
jgi:ribosomal protein L7/L12